MTTYYFDDGDSIGPGDLDMLRDVLSDLCHERGVNVKSPEGTTLGSALISLFKSGFRSRVELIFMMKDEELADKPASF